MTAVAMAAAQEGTAGAGTSGRLGPRPTGPGGREARPPGEPPGTSPVLADWLAWWAAGLDGAGRCELGRHVWRLVDSRGTPDQEARRRWLVTDWLVRTCAPRWLCQAHLHNHADLLAGLPPLSRATDPAPVRDAVEEAARAAQVQREAVTAAVAERAAGAPGWEAVGDAVRLHVIRATQPLVRTALRTGAAADRCRPVAEAVTDATAIVAWMAVDGARPAVAAATGDASALAAVTDRVAGEALAAPLGELNASAHALVERMLAVTGP